MYRISLVVLLVSAMGSVSVNAQTQSARDTFWSASDLITVTPNPAGHRRAASHTGSASNKPKSPEEVSPTVASVGKPNDNSSGAGPQLASMNGYGAPAHLVVSADNRLGLRCSVLRRDADNQYTEVQPDTVFHSGDHIRLSLLSNQPGYLYVIQQGSSGTWSPIYPPHNSGADSNKMTAGKLEIVPGGTHAFVFDQRSGDEKLYVLLSRTPVEDIDNVIRNLTNESPGSPKPDASAALEANNVISDELVQRLASRDLTLVDEEKVDQASTANTGGEKAIYVVSKQAGPQSSGQVMLSLHLQHE
jgi:hypothetical protein